MMKTMKIIPIFVISAGLLLSACSGTAIYGLAPEAVVQSAPAVQSAPTASAPPLIIQETAGQVAALQSAYEAIYQNVNPSVVTILVSSQISNVSLQPGSEPQGNQGQVVPTSEGSGFVWDSAGHIVTNNHVVDGADRISVTFSDGSTYNANLVGTDPNSDLAVIQVVDAPAALFKPVTLGDSSQVKVGQMVAAIGNPYGLSNTMTTGIVSAIARSIQASPDSRLDGSTPSFSIPDVIQTDAAINPGNSGGVLVDMSGALIGVPSQIESPSGSNSGIGFAIPSAIVSDVVPQLISKGKAEHSYLGISGGTLSADLAGALNLKAGQQGILIASVVKGGPAEAAGLKAAEVDANGAPTSAGDIITGIDGKPVTRFEDLVSYLAGYTKPGQTVTLDVLRNGVEEAQVKVTLGIQPTN